MAASSVLNVLLLFYIILHFNLPSTCYAAKLPVKKSNIAKLDRITLVKSDARYVQNVFQSAKKTNRTAPYVMNLNFTYVKPFHNNVTFSFKTFELRNNRYMESMIKYAIPFCDISDGKKWPYALLRKYGNFSSKCPGEGEFYIKDFNVDLDVLPWNFPVAQWRLDMLLTQNKLDIVMLHLQMFINVGAPVVKKIKNKITNVTPTNKPI